VESGCRRYYSIKHTRLTSHAGSPDPHESEFVIGKYSRDTCGITSRRDWLTRTGSPARYCLRIDRSDKSDLRVLFLFLFTLLLSFLLGARPFLFYFFLSEISETEDPTTRRY